MCTLSDAYFAVRAPGQDSRTRLARHGTEHIGINGHPVTQLHGYVSLHQNVAGQRAGTLTPYASFLQHQRLLLESRITHPRRLHRQRFPKRGLHFLSIDIVVQNYFLLSGCLLRTEGHECDGSCINPFSSHSNSVFER